MKAFCKEAGIAVNPCEKVVVAKDADELKQLYELEQRARTNGVEARLISVEELKGIDPNVYTYQKALYSPTTASVNPKEVCLALKNVLISQGVEFFFNERFEKKSTRFSYAYLINCAGLYADEIAHDFQAGMEYTILPFKGIYLKYMGDKSTVKTNVYPVPNLNNPFLGVHFTKTYDGSIKIGPTAIPAFWRENYAGLSRLKMQELFSISYRIFKLFITNAFHFRHIALEEIKNYNRAIFIAKAKKMVKKTGGDFQPLPSGIRAQLLNKKTSELVMDFLVEHKEGSTHVLNAVSPAFTCSFAFAEHVVDEIEKKRSL